MERHQKQHPEQPLPVIYSILLYSGEKPWTAPLDIFDLFGENSQMARDLLLAPYELVDVCRIPDEELRENILSGIMKFTLKYRQMRHEPSFYDVFFLGWRS